MSYFHHFFCLLTVIVISIHCPAQISLNDNPELAVSRIQDNLMKNASAVIRKDEMTFDIQNQGHAIEKVTFVATLLNSSVSHLSQLKVYYDKHTKIKSLSATIHDKNGFLIRKINKSDFRDYSTFFDASLFDDDRIKFIDLSQNKYPYTVSYTYEKSTKNLLQYPGFYFQSDNKFSVEKAKLTVFAPEDLQIRYKSFNIDKEPIIRAQSSKTEYTWEMNSINAFNDIPFSPPNYEVFPVVLTAPTLFNVDNYKGDMSSWESFGQWQIKLNENRDMLSAETVDKLRKLTSHATTNHEKVKILYKYLQNNTRYVSIQLGIGGWQPFLAETVDKVKYGDCKALSNYMVSMLKAIGIDSYYSIVKAGRNANPIITDFPSNQFNHVIVSVPDNNDTLWLECTSQTNPFGYLGSFTSNRDVLVIQNNNSKLYHTPRLNAHDNQMLTLCKLKILNSGSAVANVTTNFTGFQHEHLNSTISKSEKEKKEATFDQLSLPSFSINSLKFEKKQNHNPEIIRKMELSINNYCSKAGTRMFFQPNLLNRSTYIPKNDTSRKHDIFLKYPFIDIDSIQIDIPDGYTIEYLPKDTTVSNSFGKYSVNYSIEENSVNFVRYYLRNDGCFASSLYTELRQFLFFIKKQDNEKIVLLKKTEDHQ